MGFMPLLFNLLPEKLCAGYWNRQWQRSIAVWDYGHGNQNVQSCLLFDNEDREGVKNILHTMGSLPLDDDGKVKYIMSRLQIMFAMSIQKNNGGAYVSDSISHQVPDYWQTPKETLRLGTGDCDDWSILLYCLLREANIPCYRLKCVITNVVQDKKPFGLHFDLVYLARYDYEWYTIEGTWYPTIALQRYLNTPRKQSTDYYGSILFTFNEEHTWAQHDFAVKPLFLDLKELEQ